VKDAFNPDLFVAKWYCSKVWSEDMPGFAADALEAGFDGPALRRLAGLIKPTSEEVCGLFSQVIREIGNVKIHTEEQAALLLCRVTATDIVDGRIDPLRGVEILAHLSCLLDYPLFLKEFLDLAEWPYWGEYARSRQEFAKNAIQEARKLIANLPG
jgi:hypothetical protein